MRNLFNSQQFNLSNNLNICRKGKLFFGVLVGLLASTTCFNSHAQNCPNNNIVDNPQEFQWTYHPISENNQSAYYSGVMEVGEETFIINGETLTTRAYRQKGREYSIPGPTLRVKPGNKYILRLHNTLPFEPKSTSMNVFKDPNVVNLHTHGLHISGESPGDDITRSFEGGFGGDFVYDIPADHMGGTYWYHAHHHGSSFLQVSGGMFGMLIVDDSADGIPANVAAMTEREMIFGFLDTAAAGTGGDQLMSGTLSPTWTINGLVEGNICMPPNTWQHWRVLLADRNSKIRTMEFGPGSEVMLLGRDGVWRTVAPKEITTNTLELTGASRADFAIRTTMDSWVKIDGTTVANIYTNGIADTSVHPFNTDGVSSWSAVRPNYLRDLRAATNVNNESISMGARTINGSKYDHDNPTLSLPTTQVQEWSLSGAVQHPFHLHIYHLQAMDDDGDYEAGEYYDVVSAKMSVRFDLNAATSSPYDGRTILHCHILSHEDRGAMGWLDVNGGAGPPTFPANGDLEQPYLEYYSLGGAQQAPASPTSLSATAVSSSSIELTWVDNAVDEDGFDIERSTDGTSFTFVGSVGTDIETFSDNGLSPSTIYYYRITAYNSSGNSSPSNIANATTLSSGGGMIMHVANISVVRSALKGNRFQGITSVLIRDSEGSAVSGATVYGSFTGPNSSNVSGTTNTNGQVSFSSKAVKNPVGNWCFEVTNVHLIGATYDPSANVVTQVCEGSSGARIAESKGHNSEYKFLGVYPNPVQNSAKIAFQLPRQSHVVIEAYTVLGKRAALIKEQNYKQGKHILEWNAKDLSSGIYFLHLKANGKPVETRRLILMR